MLLHTLYENGITDLSELEMYCQDEVERNIYRLEDIHTRLQTSYQDILAVSLSYCRHCRKILIASVEPRRRNTRK